MYLNSNRILQTMAAAAIAIASVAGAQAPAPADQTPAAPATPTWSLGPMDISGYIDGYFSLNANRPSNTANGQVNDLYVFNDKTDQFSLQAAKLTLNHDPDPVGARIDFLYGRTNTLINAPSANSGGEGNYIEQAFLSLKPAKAKGFEIDFGKFVTLSGSEVVESKSNWNYSRSLLYSWAIPVFHFGVRAALPVSKSDTIGFQVVNGWNNVTKSNGGVTIGWVNTLTKVKYTWTVDGYSGPENANTQKGYRNLIDTTLLLTPNSKFNAWINYDYAQNRDAVTGAGKNATGDTLLKRWQGVAFAARQQVTAKAALAGRFEYYKDYQGFTTGTAQQVDEITGTYEYMWPEGLLARLEYRRDWSNLASFHKGNTGFVDAQSTVTAGFVAFFGPKR